jgi:methyltransferase
MYFAIFIAVLALQRLGELWLAKRNAMWIRSQGGYEVGAEHYTWMVLMHISWFLAMVAEYVLLRPDLPALWPIWLGLFLLAQVGRYMVIATLGKFWNTRIFVLPNAPKVEQGIYRYMKHPNYWIVRVEIFVAPMIFGLFITAILFSILNHFMLQVRIKTEEQALKVMK